MNSKNKNNGASSRSVRRRRNGRASGVKVPSPLIREFPSVRRMRTVSYSDGLVQASAANYACIDFRLIDITNNGLVGGTGAFTTSISGITDMAAYALARPRSFEIDFNGVSVEGTNVITICLAFSDTQISTTVVSLATAKLAMASFLHTEPLKLSATLGMNRFDLKKFRLTPQQILGDKMESYDRDFVTAVNPSHVAPNQELWGAILCTTTGATLTLGADVSLVLSTNVEAFSRLPGA